MHIHIVAPYTGAWIEIQILLQLLGKQKVAPYTGAWIEIVNEREKPIIKMSHPTRVRGLKFQYVLWKAINLKSHPTRVRGLKF